MGCEKNLAKGEEVLVRKKIVKVRTNKSIAKRIDRCVMTEIGESVRNFKKMLQREETSVVSGEASPTIWSCYANFSVFIDYKRNQFLKK